MSSRVALVALGAPVLLVVLLTTLGPFATSPVALWGGIGVDGRLGWLRGYGTIDPNEGVTSFALGVRAALEVLSGKLPLWNHFEGLGAPLLGEMQSAALFPPTLLLLLPHGQAIEQALLQLVGGLGTYLFLRRFGLGVTAAMAGGLLYEFNGVFAWLRNAVYNPVAFLPWLFYAVESLFRAVRDGERCSKRWPIICLGGLTAALALYAGFPEVVYFYGLLLAGWSGLRAMALPRSRLTAFFGGLAAVALLALLISAPLLLTFLRFLREADVGGHHGSGFRNAYLVPQAFIVALLPYFFGPIFSAPRTAIMEVWGGIGGYLGLAPLLLAAGGVFCRWRRPTTWLLVSWVVLAVGASHGAPGLHAVFTAIPLASLASYCRYLDASWIFAGVVLGACFIDQVDGLAASSRRAAGRSAAAAALCLLALGLILAWPVIEAMWNAKEGQRLPVILSLGAASVLMSVFLLLLRAARPSLGLVALAFTEAFAAFLLPFLSYPRVERIDQALVAFLQQHAGFQRVATASGDALAPNFGSVFGIRLINYDDLPVPLRTADFVRNRLHSPSGGLIFRPNANPESPAEKKRRFLDSMAAYQAAGVRYVLANDVLFADPRPVLKTRTTTVFEMTDFRPYASAAGCQVAVAAQDRIEADCPAPSRLLRLEAYLEDWHARVNGSEARVVPVEDVFQGVDLPAGRSVVEFAYAPPAIRQLAFVAAAVVLLCLAGLVFPRALGRA